MSTGIADEPAIRIGHGFDIHRLKEGTKLIIGGVDIPYHLGADAHSDGDALYHWFVPLVLFFQRSSRTCESHHNIVLLMLY